MRALDPHDQRMCSASESKVAITRSSLHTWWNSGYVACMASCERHAGECAIKGESAKGCTTSVVRVGYSWWCDVAVVHPTPLAESSWLTWLSVGAGRLMPTRVAERIRGRVPTSASVVVPAEA